MRCVGKFSFSQVSHTREILQLLLKCRLSKTRGWQFHKWLFGPEKFSGLSRNGPQVTKHTTVKWSIVLQSVKRGIKQVFQEQ